MKNKLWILTLILCVAFMAGCSTSTANNSNAVAENTTKPAPDNSEITTKVDATGVKTEERVFRNNPRINRVVVTTKEGKRTIKAYSPKGEEKSVTAETEDVLVATGDKVADAAGFVADKGEDVAGEAKDVAGKAADKAEDVGDKTVDAAKNVGNQTADGAKKVGSKTASGAKKVGNAAVSGAKKAGSAIKKVVP